MNVAFHPLFIRSSAHALLLSSPRASSSPDHAACSQIGSSASRCRRRAAQQLDCSKLGADQHTPRACAKQSTPWQPCCAGALLLQFARHTQHASAAHRQRRRRWPNRARASRGAPSPTTRLMIGAGPPPAVLELIFIEKCINVSTGTVGVMRAGAVLRVRAVEKSFVGQRTRPRASSS